MMAGMRRCWLFALVVTLACKNEPPAPSRSLPPPEPKPPATAKAAPRPSAAPAVGAEAARLPAVERLVAIGDLHGDLDASRQVLRLAGAIDAGDEWVGGNLVIVQTGDQIDRGDEDREVLDLLVRVKAAAQKHGGAVHVLNGNHETMNVAGDFRYVTKPSFRSFAGADARKLPDAVARLLPTEAQPRAAAFLPGGSYAEILAPQPVILIVGDSVFAHGGVLPEHVAYGIDRINSEVGAWIAGKGELPALMQRDDAPVWTRLYSEPQPSAVACATLGKVLSSLLVRRMVVGHTVQERGITSACDDQVYRIDVGLSRYYRGTTISALELGKTGPHILTAPRSGAAALPEAAE